MRRRAWVVAVTSAGATAGPPQPQPQRRAGVLPATQRVAVLANNRHPGVGIELESTAGAMQHLVLAQRCFPLQQPQDLEAARAAVAAEPFDALPAFPDSPINRLVRAPSLLVRADEVIG